MTRAALLLTCAAVLGSVGWLEPARAAGPADPCAGGLSTTQILGCLKPNGSGATRGIRPAGPGATSAPVSGAKAPPESSVATVNLLVPFAFDSADLTPRGMAALDALVAALKDPALAGGKFQIAGHTDGVGSDAYNMALSEKRAEAALQYLVTHGGLDASRLVAVGFGKSQPYNPDSPDAPINRRVQVSRLES